MKKTYLGIASVDLQNETYDQFYFRDNFKYCETLLRYFPLHRKEVSCTKLQKS
jgi:hypothetical protein